MNIKNKLVFHSVTFKITGTLIYILTGLLTMFNIIDATNIMLNGIIYAISSIVCISYFAFIYYTYMHTSRTATIKDCVIMGAVTIALGVPEFFIGMKTAGVHLSITAPWTTAALSLTVHNIILYLELADEIHDATNKKYSKIISELRTWINGCFFGTFFFGLGNVLFPEAFVF